MALRSRVPDPTENRAFNVVSSINELKILQIKLHYGFVNDQRLYAALTSAHREKEDGLHDDGNRGLAYYGILVMQMAMAYEAIMDQGKTLYDVHTQEHWSRTKKGRANTCRLLGIEPLIVRSVWQQNQFLSDTVLDHALSAVLGAIWLDCEEQNHNSARVRSTILEVLGAIDAILDEDSTVADCVTKSPIAEPNLTTNSLNDQPESMDLHYEDFDDIEEYTRDWFLRYVDGLSSDLPLLPETPTLELRLFADYDGCTVSPDAGLSRQVDVPASSRNECFSAYGGLDIDVWAETSRDESEGNGSFNVGRKQYDPSRQEPAFSDATTTVAGAKRKRSQNEEQKADFAYRDLLQAEREKLVGVSGDNQEALARYLEHPLLDNLDKNSSALARFLYLAIGSWETIVDFDNLCQLARRDSRICKQSDVLFSNDSSIYAEICRLEEGEALSALLRRYYVLRLCDEERLYNDHHDQIIVDTPSTFVEGRAVRPGNPANAVASGLTKRLLAKIMPNSDPVSDEFRKARARVKRLRRLAGRLRILVNQYGFGILGLLPSGPSFERMSLTDNMLLSITQESFNDFAGLLNQEQGTHLRVLSRFIEPLLLAVATGSFNSDSMCATLHVSHLKRTQQRSTATQDYIPSGDGWRSSNYARGGRL